jgi:hypothetical protein
LSFVAVLALALVPAVPSLAQGALDGRAYAVQIEDPTLGAMPDHLVFADGQFESMGCRPFGFGPASYTAEAGSNAVTATATSATEGTMAWTAQVEGDAITGSVTWSKPGQDPVTYAFTGPLAGGPLDGHTFTVVSSGAEAMEGMEDTLIFAQGAFESTGCREYGFYPVTYTSAEGADGITFSAVAQSMTEGTMTWTGSVGADGAIQGNAVWAKEGQDSMAFSFTGVAPAGTVLNE